MMPTIPMLLLFTDSILFPPADTFFMITEDGYYMVLEDGVTRMITE